MRQARTPHRWRSRGQELPLLHGFPVMSLSSFHGSFSLRRGADLCGTAVGPSDEEPRVSGGAAAGPCGRSVGPRIYGEKLADERSVSLSSVIRGYIQEGKVKEGEGEAWSTRASFCVAFAGLEGATGSRRTRNFTGERAERYGGAMTVWYLRQGGTSGAHTKLSLDETHTYFLDGANKGILIFAFLICCGCYGD